MIQERLDQIEADIPLAARSPEMAQHFTYDHGTELLAALRAVLDLHKPMTMYEHEDCCENDSDDHREERHAEDVNHGGEFFCMDLPTGIVLCAECSSDLDFDGRDYPCPTVRAVTAALGEEA